MPTPRLTDEQLREAVELRERHHYAKDAAEELGIAENTFRHRLKEAAKRGLAPGHFDNGVAPAT